MISNTNHSRTPPLSIATAGSPDCVRDFSAEELNFLCEVLLDPARTCFQCSTLSTSQWYKEPSTQEDQCNKCYNAERKALKRKKPSNPPNCFHEPFFCR